MVWLNPPPTVLQFRTQLLLCPSLVAYLEAVYHYPSADPERDPMPYVLLQEPKQTRNRYAEGAVPLISGTLVAAIFDTTLDTGAFEKLGRQVNFELCTQYFGLAIQSVEAGLASNPTPGAKAESENEDGEQMSYRAFLITVNYGLKA